MIAAVKALLRPLPGLSCSPHNRYCGSAAAFANCFLAHSPIARCELPSMLVEGAGRHRRRMGVECAPAGTKGLPLRELGN